MSGVEIISLIFVHTQNYLQILYCVSQTRGGIFLRNEHFK